MPSASEPSNGSGASLSDSWAPTLIGLIAVSLAGCSSERSFAMWPEAELSVAFLLSVSSTGVVISELGPIPITESDAPTLEITPPEAGDVLLLGFSQELLEGLAPGARSEAVERFVLNREPRSCLDGAIDLEAGTARLPIPEESLYRLDAKAGRFVATSAAEVPYTEDWAITIPVRSEPCRDQFPPTLQPFAREAKFLEADSSLRGRAEVPVRKIVSLDEDHLVVLTQPYLFVVERGQSSAPLDSGHLFGAFEIDSRRQGTFTTIARDASYAGPGHRLFATAYFQTQPSGEHLEILIEDNAIGRVRTATTHEEDLDTVVIDNRGVLVVGAENEFLTATPPDGPLVHRPLPARLIPTDINQLVVTGDPQSPHAAGLDDGIILLGDAVDGHFRETKLPVGADGVVARGTDAGVELWVSGIDGLFFRIDPSGDWTDLRYTLPLAAAACANGADACGFARAAARWRELELGEDYFFAADHECTGVTVIERKTLCVTVLPLPNRTFELGKDLGARTISVVGNRVLVGGSDGEVWELSLP